MDRIYPAGTPPVMQRIYDKFCEPRLVTDLSAEDDIRLMTTRVDPWDMRRESPSGPHEANMSMWSTPFSGGIAIARYILKHPDRFAGKTVLDIGAGSGLVAIAAARAGAKAIAIDSSRMACMAIATNAALNSVSVIIGEGDVTTPQGMIWIEDDLEPYKDLTGRADIVTAGDIFYNHNAATIARTLASFAATGTMVYASSGEEDMDEVFPTPRLEVLSRHHYSKRPSFIRLPGACPARILPPPLALT